MLTVIRGNAAEPHEVDAGAREERGAGRDRAACSTARVGYIRIPAFTPTTARRCEAPCRRAGEAGAKALIIDIRRTAEGRIEHGIATARLFVEVRHARRQGRTRAGRPRRKPHEGTDRRRAPATGRPLPVQLLMSAGTSGAAEVFAAALDGNKRADLVGEHTIGRAAAQKLVKLPEQPRAVAHLRPLPHAGRRTDSRRRAQARRRGRRAGRGVRRDAAANPIRCSMPRFSTRRRCGNLVPPR